MTPEQFSHRIGNVDDQLLRQAEQFEGGARRRPGGMRRALLLAAVVALMVCSFAVGAFAFSTETVVEVPVAQETITLDALGLTLILPDDWKDQYGVELDEDGMGANVYVKSIHDGAGDWAGGGYLFYIRKAYNEVMTPEELEEISPVAFRYLFARADGTYLLIYASDVQYDPADAAQTALYTAMARQIADIRVVVDYACFNTVQNRMRTVTAEDLKQISSASVPAEDLAAALNGAAAHEAAYHAGLTGAWSLTAYLVDAAGEYGEDGLRFTLSAGETENLVQVRYAGTGIYWSENPDNPSFYLHDFDETIYVEDAALYALVRQNGD